MVAAVKVKSSFRHMLFFALGALHVTLFTYREKALSSLIFSNFHNGVPFRDDVEKLLSFEWVLNDLVWLHRLHDDLVRGFLQDSVCREKELHVSFILPFLFLSFLSCCSLTGDEPRKALSRTLRHRLVRRRVGFNADDGDDVLLASCEGRDSLFYVPHKVNSVPLIFKIVSKYLLHPMFVPQQRDETRGYYRK